MGNDWFWLMIFKQKDRERALMEIAQNAHSLQLVQPSRAWQNTPLRLLPTALKKASTHALFDPQPRNAQSCCCRQSISPSVIQSVGTVVPRGLDCPPRALHVPVHFLFLSLDECVFVSARQAWLGDKYAAKVAVTASATIESNRGNRAQDIQLGLPRLWRLKKKKEGKKMNFSVYILLLGHSNSSCCCCMAQAAVLSRRAASISVT